MPIGVDHGQARLGSLDFLQGPEVQTQFALDDTQLDTVKTGAAKSVYANAIKSWGFGFWPNVSQVLGALLLAEATGRVPLVHWGRNSLFGDGSARDAFGHYFEPVSNVTLEDLATIPDANCFPPKMKPAEFVRGGTQQMARQLFACGSALFSCATGDDCSVRFLYRRDRRGALACGRSSDARQATPIDIQEGHSRKERRSAYSPTTPHRLDCGVSAGRRRRPCAPRC